MHADPRHLRLIARLARGLAPVARLASPMRRALGWCLLVALPGAGLAGIADTRATLHRLTGEPWLALASAGALLTAVAAALGAVLSALPDRDARWALLPLPGIALWLGAGLGGASAGEGDGHRAASLAQACACAGFILGLGAAFALLLAGILVRAHPLRPRLTAGLAGLAAAAAAACLLQLFHPFAMARDDLALHALAVAAMTLGCAALGTRLLARG